MLYKCQAGTVLNIWVRELKEIKFSERNRSPDSGLTWWQFFTSESEGREKLKETDDRDKRCGHIAKFCNEVVFKLSLDNLNEISFQGLFLAWAVGNMEGPFPPK